MGAMGSVLEINMSQTLGEKKKWSADSKGCRKVKELLDWPDT